MTGAAWLRGLGADGLAALLSRRPEALAPPVPTSLTEMSERLADDDVAPCDGGVLFPPEPIYHRSLNGRLSGIAAITWTPMSSNTSRFWLIRGWAERDDPDHPHAQRIRGYARQDPTPLSRLGPYVLTDLNTLPVGEPVAAIGKPHVDEPDRDWETGPDGRYVIADDTVHTPGPRRHRLRVLAHQHPTPGHRRPATPGPGRAPPRRPRQHHPRHPRGHAAPHQPDRRTRPGRGDVALPRPVHRQRSLAPPHRQARPALPRLDPPAHQIC